MRSESYLDTLILEVKQQVSAVQSSKDFLKFYNWMKSHDNLIQAIQALEPLPIEPLVDSNKDVLQIEQTSITEINEPLENEVNQEVIGKTFRFVKKALGGSIEEIGYHIYEDVVRLHQIEHGNLLLIKGIEGRLPNGKPRYSFEIVDNTAIKHNKLINVTQGIVEFVHGKYIVRRTTSKNVNLNGSDITLFVQLRDIEKHKLKEGDIIDGRFYNNSLESFRITYKYPIEQETTDKSIEGLRLANRKKNEKKDGQSSISMLDRLEVDDLKDKNILLVGLASRRNDFQLMLDNYPHIKFKHLTGDEREITLRNTIAQSDIVLVSTTENSHNTSKLTTSICKELNVPITSTSADGLYMILYKAIEFLNQIKSNQMVI